MKAFSLILKASLLVPLLTGCMTPKVVQTSKSWAFSSPMISVEASAPPEGQLTDLGPVRGRYCPDQGGWFVGRIGILDEAVRRALKNKNATYLADVHFRTEHDKKVPNIPVLRSRVIHGCLVVEGRALK